MEIIKKLFSGLITIFPYTLLNIIPFSVFFIGIYPEMSRISEAVLIIITIHLINTIIFMFYLVLCSYLANRLSKNIKNFFQTHITNFLMYTAFGIVYTVLMIFCSYLLLYNNLSNSLFISNAVLIMLINTSCTIFYYITEKSINWLSILKAPPANSSGEPKKDSK